MCLFQLSTRAADYIIDPLAIADMSPLGSVLANPRIEKIFHAAEYDIIGIKRDFGFDIYNIFRHDGWQRASVVIDRLA